MKSQKVVISNETGLHARPAALFVEEAKKHSSSITVQKEGKPAKANGKSIVFLLSLGIAKGDTITISADGSDEEVAVDSLVRFLQEVKE
jgi:phosphotransferase system HPr (HPr) family protein